jgi:peroxisomal enoyl-CoA hydratase 2
LFDEVPNDVQWNDWGSPVRVQIEHGPVMLFARAVKDPSAVYTSERVARSASFERVPVPPTYTFVMQHAGAFPDLQPDGSTRSMFPSGAGSDRKGLYLHGEQHFEYHRAVAVGDVLEGRLRVSEPIARHARRGPMEVTHFQTRWSDTDGTPVVDERIVSLFFPEA